MKKNLKSIGGLVVTIIAVGITTPNSSAQLPIKIKIPKTAQAQPTPTESSQPAATDTQSTQPPAERNNSGPGGGGPYAQKPAPPDTPMLLSETLEIKTATWDYYWKAPGQSNYTSWLPRVHFYVKYRGPARLRFKADYSMPDGQPWFSESLEQKGGDEEISTFLIDSPYGTDDDKKTIAVPGIFGVKITNIKDNSIVFQGKFKVIRFKPETTDARYKNLVDFYVDQDWLLPIGHTDVHYEPTLSDALPYVRMWFKGGFNQSDLEARLYYNGKQLATTDEGGNVGSVERRFPKHVANDPALQWQLYEFSWPHKISFIMAERARSYPDSKRETFINQMPGEYTVKVFYKGEQVRETRFRIADGNFADNGIAKQNGISTDKIFLPVKVMGNVDKWNAANWRTEGFYGNPLTGFVVP